jgi:hypothetical protein
MARAIEQPLDRAEALQIALPAVAQFIELMGDVVFVFNGWAVAVGRRYCTFWLAMLLWAHRCGPQRIKRRANARRRRLAISSAVFITFLKKQKIPTFGSITIVGIRYAHHQPINTQPTVLKAKVQQQAA